MTINSLRKVSGKPHR